jgi:hypothetical protein
VKDRTLGRERDEHAQKMRRTTAAPALRPVGGVGRRELVRPFEAARITAGLTRLIAARETDEKCVFHRTDESRKLYKPQDPNTTLKPL